jgi:hypothetical protein
LYTPFQCHVQCWTHPWNVTSSVGHTLGMSRPVFDTPFQCHVQCWTLLFRCRAHSLLWHVQCRTNPCCVTSSVRHSFSGVGHTLSCHVQCWTHPFNVTSSNGHSFSGVGHTPCVWVWGNCRSITCGGGWQAVLRARQEKRLQQGRDGIYGDLVRYPKHDTRILALPHSG